MKKRCACIVCLAVIAAVCFALTWFYTRPSLRHTASFAVQHQELLEDFIDLCRAEIKQPPKDGKLKHIYYAARFADTLMCYLDTDTGHLSEYDVPVSSELGSAWQRIQNCRYFTGVSCSFDENGAMEVHFFAEGKWTPYDEGNYCQCHCLVWRDSDYAKRPLESWWYPLGAADGMSTTSKGGWYYSVHKHLDG